MMNASDHRNIRNDWLFKNKATFIAKIKHGNLQSTSGKNVSDFTSVGSYNWSSQSTPKKPIIKVPGTPNYLKQDIKCQQLIMSNFQQICSENQYFMSDYPLQPMLRAVTLCTPEFDFKTIDLITERINLRKLLNFVEENLSESFRIDIQLIENETLIFIRNDEHILMPCRDYNKDFKEKFSEKGSKDRSYWKIVTHMIGDIRVMSQFEVDCVETVSYPSAAELKPTETEPIKFNQNSKLSYIAGNSIDLQNEKLVEMSTKSIWKEEYTFPNQKWSQLVFSNIHVLLLGWHKKGNLQKIERLSFDEVTERCGRKKADTQKSIGKLHALLKMIKEIIKNQGDHGSVFALVYDKDAGENSLEIFEVSNHSGCLPHELKMMLF